MFIRATKTHLVDVQPGYSYRLVRSVRRDAKVQQKTVLNLGTDYSFPRALWPHVTRLTEDLLSGQAPLLAAEPEVIATSETLVRRARDRTRSVGTKRLALQALNDLGLP